MTYWPHDGATVQSFTDNTRHLATDFTAVFAVNRQEISAPTRSACNIV